MRAAQRLAGLIPLRLSSAVVGGASRAFAWANPAARVIARRNLERAWDGPLDDAELAAAEREVFRSYGRYWLDSVRLTSLDADAIDRGFAYTDLHHVTDALETGLPPILALPHVGGWEWAGSWLSKVQGWKVAAVAERLEPPELNDWFVEFRAELGMDIVTLGPDAVTEIAAKVASGYIVCLLCDRDLSGDGIEVEFFGERTRLPGGPALLALRTGAPLVPCAVYFEGDHCHAIVLPPLDTERRGRLRADVQRVTQDLADALESLIRRAPQQWHLLQPNWPSDFEAIGHPAN